MPPKKKDDHQLYILVHLCRRQSRHLWFNQKRTGSQATGNWFLQGLKYKTAWFTRSAIVVIGLNVNCTYTEIVQASDSSSCILTHLAVPFVFVIILWCEVDWHNDISGYRSITLSCLFFACLDTQSLDRDLAAMETCRGSLGWGHMDPERPQRPMMCTVMWTSWMVREQNVGHLVIHTMKTYARSAHPMEPRTGALYTDAS